MRSRPDENSTTSSKDCDRDPVAPELALLLACVTPGSGTRDLEYLVAERIDWDRLLSMASWHGVLGFVSRRLAAIADSVPGPVSQFLAECDSLIARQNLLLSSELLEISAAFTRDGIEHIAYKGTVLGEYLYSTLAVRTSSDIDLLVRPEDRFQAIGSLERLGFSEAYALTPSQRTAAFHFGFEHPFCRNGVMIDLHWHPVQRYAWSISTRTIWSNTVPFAFLGRTLQKLSPELNLATLCIHSAQHELAHLRMFSDIAKLITLNPQLDWDLVQAFVPDAHSKRSFLIALRLVHANLDVPLPHQLLERIEGDQEVVRIARFVKEKSWPSVSDPVPSHLNFRLLLSRTRGEACRDRFRYLSGVLLLPTLADFRSLKLPRPLQCFYYLLRPGRMLLGRVIRRFSVSV